MGLFTRYDELLTQDPIKYWRSLSDIRQFFSLLGLFQFLSMQTSFYAVDWLLSFNTFKQTLYSRLVIFKSFTFAQFCLKLWFNELPVMYKLSQRYPNLYADDSLCPICGIFMETLKHLFVCSPSHLDAKDDISELLNQRILPQNLLNVSWSNLLLKRLSYPDANKYMTNSFSLFATYQHLASQNYF
ncbi:unnamed protein product [Rhizophagus irregularis]|nr:unnamed protein product [Rhizophagus irregularis]